MTMVDKSECPNLKTGKGGEAKPCGKKRLYRVVQEEGAVGPYWTIALGTPIHEPELCKACATLDAMARNRTAQIQRGMKRAAEEARQAGQEPPGEAEDVEPAQPVDLAARREEAAAWESARQGDEEPGA